MAEVLGFLAGCGMLSLVGLLALRFLGEMQWIRPETARLARRSGLIAGGAGLMYLAAAALHHLVVYGAQSELGLDALFQAGYMARMFQALSQPSDVGPLSMAFAWLGHGLGAALFGQYRLAGLWLAWGMTAVSVGLIFSRLRAIAGEQTAGDAVFLLLCLPLGPFALLPGWAPLALLLLAAGFYGLGKTIGRVSFRISPTALGTLTAVSAAVSAAVTVCLADGKLG